MLSEGMRGVYKRLSVLSLLCACLLEDPSSSSGSRQGYYQQCDYFGPSGCGVCPPGEYCPGNAGVPPC